MHVITAKRVHEYIKDHPDARTWLSDWLAVAKAASWSSIVDVRQLYPHADAVEVGSGGTVTVFNVGGNNYRLVTAIHYNRKKVYVLKFLTHAEYDKELWKQQL